MVGVGGWSERCGWVGGWAVGEGGGEEGDGGGSSGLALALGKEGQADGAEERHRGGIGCVPLDCACSVTAACTVRGCVRRVCKGVG